MIINSYNEINLLNLEGKRRVGIGADDRVQRQKGH
jgi:hypothetical protein